VFITFHWGEHFRCSQFCCTRLVPKQLVRSQAFRQFIGLLKGFYNIRMICDNYTITRSESDLPLVRFMVCIYMYTHTSEFEFLKLLSVVVSLTLSVYIMCLQYAFYHIKIVHCHFGVVPTPYSCLPFVSIRFYQCVFVRGMPFLRLFRETVARIDCWIHNISLSFRVKHLGSH
jgi:hypothetical protein